jgi:hypothetical protein
MSLESDLKDVLQRVDPPDGFAERVMGRVAAGFSPQVGGLKATAPWKRALAAALLLAITIGGWGIHETLRARNELLTAMRIASEKVAHAQQQVNRR